MEKLTPIPLPLDIVENIMMNSSKPDIVVILGMHGSDSSAISRSMQYLGCDLGNNRIQPVGGVNDNGLREDPEISAFNQSLLESMGRTWSTCSPLPTVLPDFAPLQTRQHEAELLLLGKIHGNATFAFQDTPTTILLPFWQSVFQRVGLSAVYLIVLRSPLNVVQAHLRRDGFSREKSLLLWYLYSRSALECTHQSPRTVTHYGRLLQYPHCELQRIATRLGLQPPVPQHSPLPAALNDFPNTAQGGGCEDDAAFLADPTVPAAWKHLYRQLESMACEGSDVRADLTAAIALEFAEQRVFWQHIGGAEHQAACAEESLAVAHRQQMESLGKIKELEEQVRKLQAETTTMLASNSWRLTYPLRQGRLTLRHAGQNVRNLMRKTAKFVWRRLPLSMAMKGRIKYHLLAHQQTQLAPSSGHKTEFDAVPLPEIYVPCRPSTSCSWRRPVRVIAFYLPQFHEIPENNLWWGKGFTEWTNVRPAEPIFPGHYQPHVPEQGYYDLTDPEVLPRQAALARSYGIEGFCFYFYWFAGRTLLEKPLQLVLDHPEWHMPFCLCWANENWTRRWDGLEHDVLIGQNHSPEDDRNFIGHLHRYLKDPRYIRVEGKPLLVVYRAEILPDARATVACWRKACRESGLGEIFVACVQAFSNVDPAQYGMNAAVEFPPNNSAPPEIKPQSRGAAAHFSGHLYDWRILPERSKHYLDPGYTLYRGLNPGWDNTPRRKQAARIFLGNHPVLYQQWADRAIDDTLKRFSKPGERLIFVNAWNEWSEGAHLEPDARTGCAYLDATSMALLRTAIRQGTLPPANLKTAIVIHAYYSDVLDEILAYVERLGVGDFHVWVTTTAENENIVRDKLSRIAHPVEIAVYPNRGRDVLPFLEILPRLLAAGYATIIKVHTKKSAHRDDGSSWLHSCLDKLLSVNAVAAMRQASQTDADTGIWGPKEYIVPMAYFWGSNAQRTATLAMRLGVQPDSLPEIPFMAGTMFACRRELLWVINALRLNADDFEEEQGQLDGTMAHAVERIFGVAVRSIGKRITGI